MNVNDWAYSERRGLVKSEVKSLGSNRELQRVLPEWSSVEGSRVPSVEVRSVEDENNSGREGGPLDET